MIRINLLNEDYDYIPPPEKRIIPGYEDYLAYSDGRIFSCIKERFLSQHDRNGYRGVGVAKYYDRKSTCASVHSLIASAFLGERPPGYFIDHIDGDRTNNHISNLEYVTPSENQLRYHRRRRK